MGMQTDYAIAEFRKEAGITSKTSKKKAAKLLKAAGIKPAKGKQKELLEQIIDVAVGEDNDAIGCVKAELSGERDGDGHWHGSDAVSAAINELRNACQEWIDWEKKVHEAENVLRENEDGTDDDA